MDGMSKLLARAGKGLTYKLPTSLRHKEGSTDEESGSEDDDDDGDNEKEEDRPFEPLMLWQSPHNGGEALGLPPKM